MKKFKKIFAALAASALVAAMSFTSMAASIQINRGSAEGTNNTTYDYYQVLKASVSSDESSVAYYVNDKDLADAINDLTDSAGKDIFTVTSSVDKTKYNVILNNGMTDKGKDIADAFKTIVDNTELVGKIASGPITKNSDGIYKTADLDGGYYLIVSSLGTKLAINTATGGVNDVCEITEKNTYPTIDKFVDALDNHQANHNIGDDVPYIIKVTVPEYVDTKLTITINDEMAKGFLKFNDDVTAVDGTNTKFEAFTTEVESDSNNSKFAITLNDLKKAKGKTITFKYTAKLLQAAEKNTYYDNKAQLSYSNYVTLEKTASVRTFAFDLKKVNEAKTELTGAKFELRTIENDSNSAINFVADDTKKNYVKADTTATTASKTIEAGNVNIRGIKDGTYYLVETEAPQGYNVLDHAITIVIDENGIVTDHTGNVVEVENKKGLVLPSTGGMGTTVFAIVGLLVMAGAAVTLIIKKRA